MGEVITLVWRLFQKFKWNSYVIWIEIWKDQKLEEKALLE